MQSEYQDNLERFVLAQEKDYPTAKAELREITLDVVYISTAKRTGL